MNICTGTLCQNGGTCIESSNQLGYVCQCQAGFMGQICQMNINECLSSPCYNNGTCYDRVNSYQCFCPPGFNGLRCEFETNDCSSAPCLYGQCVTQRPFGFMCVCPQSRTGVRCDVRINECASAPCKNGGLCTQLNPFGFQCQCLAGYQGMFCEISINPCDSSPCLNGGSCASRGTQSWQCACRCGYTGARCESVINECANNPCRNGGTCTQPKPCGFVCACPQEPVPFYGQYCEFAFNQPGGNNNGFNPSFNNPRQIHSAEHTLFFRSASPSSNNQHSSASAVNTIGRLKFKDIVENVLTAYNTENINNRNVCPATFTLVGNACYKILGETTYAWPAAKSQCLSLGSHLAWFASAQELDLVKAWLNGIGLITSDIWIGGKLDHSNWLWDFNNTGIPLGVLMQNWAPGKPTPRNTATTPASPSSSQAFDFGFKKHRAMLMSRHAGFLFADEDADKGEYLALCKRAAFFLDNSVARVIPVHEIHAVDVEGNPLVGFRFQTNVSQSQADAIAKVYAPSSSTFSTIFQQLPVEHGQFYSGTAFPYSSPFTLSLCGDLTHSQAEQVRQTVRNTWRQVRAASNQDNDNFDVHLVAVDKYTDQASAVNTQVSYISKAGREIIESTTSNSPSTAQIFTALQRIGFAQCVARARRSLGLLDVAVASPSLARDDYEQLQRAVQSSLLAVRPDFVTNQNNVSVRVVANRDALDLTTRSAVTQVYMQVSVDGRLVDFYTQTEFDAEQLLAELNYQNENGTLPRVLVSTRIYARNYFFTIVSATRVRRSHYPLIEQNVLDIFLDTMPEYRSQNVSVTVTWQEECVDENRALVHGLSILISLNDEPINNLLTTLDKSVFVKLRTVKIAGNEVYSLRLPAARGEYLHPLSKSLEFYSSILVCRRDYAKIERLVHSILLELVSPKFASNSTAAGDRDELMVMIVHQDELIHKNG
jgi:hypothetical protein